MTTEYIKSQIRNAGVDIAIIRIPPKPGDELTLLDETITEENLKPLDPSRSFEVRLRNCKGIIRLAGGPNIGSLFLSGCEDLKVIVVKGMLKELTAEDCRDTSLDLQQCEQLHLVSYRCLSPQGQARSLSKLDIVGCTIKELHLQQISLNSDSGKAGSKLNVDMSTIGNLRLSDVDAEQAVSFKASSISDAEVDLSGLVNVRFEVCTITKLDLSCSAAVPMVADGGPTRRLTLSGVTVDQVTCAPALAGNMAGVELCISAGKVKSFLLHGSKERETSPAQAEVPGEYPALGRLHLKDADIEHGIVVNMRIAELRCVGAFSPTTRLALRNTFITRFCAEQLYNAGVLSFIACSFGKGQEAGLEWRNSDLGKVNFHGCTFSGGEEGKAQLESSVISAMLLAGTEFPLALAVVQGDAPSHEQALSHLAQLRKAYEGSSDTVRALGAQSAYLRMVKKRMAVREAGFRAYWKQAGDRFTLVTSHLSNNFGVGVGRSFLWLLGLGICFFALFCWAQGYPPTNPVDGWRKFLTLAAHFPEFLNPVHKSDFLAIAPGHAPKPALAATLAGAEASKPVFANDWARVLDGLSRIVLAYLLYQFVSAFRKFGRS